MMFFLDTNFLLHFKDLSDIDWSDVTQADHIRIAICSNTQRELDKKKFETRGRTQQRARKWVQRIAEIIDSDDVLELRTAGPRITVELHLDRPASWSPPSDLDTSVVGDDNFVAEVLAFRDANPGTECALISADIGPIGKAKRHGLPAIPAMNYDWDLPPEADDRGKKINQLEKALKAANEQHPEISAVTTVNGKEVSQLVIEATVYPPLPEARIAELLAELQRKYPCATDFPKPGEDYKPPERKGLRPTPLIPAAPIWFRRKAAAHSYCQFVLVLVSNLTRRHPGAGGGVAEL